VPPAWRDRPGRIEVVEASHPVPDDAGRQAAARMAPLLRGLGPDDLVIALISGGGSALLSLPAPGLSLADKQAVNKALLASGAAIDEMNCVRKHLSAIKGGRLAQAAGRARMVTLLISDVPGDDPSIIASGPTVPDASTCADALAICRRYGIALPDAARAGLESGAFETPKPGDACFQGHQLRMIATPQASLEAGAAAARAAGLQAHILSDEIEGESRDVGKVHAALARAVARHGQPFARPCVMLSGGETTVTLRAQAAGATRGRGGRATEFLLGCAIALQGQPGVHVLAADTDGIDGIEDNAGAIVTPDTLARAAALGIKAVERLDGNDAYGFFSALGDLVHTGPTFTNVNDFRALLVL
jgi:hydroxypyruvate reductase